MTPTIENTASRLVGINDVAGPMIKISKRAWLRLCEEGKAPWGVKLGARRLWDRAELECWISHGCPAVHAGRGAK